MLAALLKNQTIQIDAHKRGTSEEILWDLSRNDIHIHKRTNWKVEGKPVEVEIIIPVNSNREIRVEIKQNIRNKTQAIATAERQLVKEIKQALSDKKIREAFLADLLAILSNYKTALSSKDRALVVIDRLAKHFSLKPIVKKEMVKFSEEKVSEITKLFRVENKLFRVNLNSERIIIGQIVPNITGFSNRNRSRR